MNIDNDEQYKAAPDNNQERDEIDQILDDFYDGVFIEEQPKAKAAIKQLLATQRQALRDEVMGAIRKSKPTAGKYHYMSEEVAAIHDKAVKQYSDDLRTAISTIFEGKD